MEYEKILKEVLAYIKPKPEERKKLEGRRWNMKKF